MLSGSIVEDFDTTDGSITTAAKAVLDAVGDKLLEGLDPNGSANAAVLILPPAGELPEVNVTDYKSRETPSSVTSRRIKQYLIG
jgi:hypothetical protein